MSYRIYLYLGDETWREDSEGDSKESREEN